MAKTWSPHRMTVMRRIRVAAVAAAVTVASCITFGVTARKSVALTVNGQTTHVTTYAPSIYALLKEQHIDVKTHDIVTSDSPEGLTDHATITVKSAYQTTISIDGQQVPFWTVADSAEQLIGFFEQNNVEASRITVDIPNVYNQLTGGITINAHGPVTVIADGKTMEAPDGNQPAAAIFDSLGITIGKDDRVSVQKKGNTTILRVQRVTHDRIEEHESIPFETRTVVDATLAPGETKVMQAGVNGERVATYDVVYVDGKEESRTLVSENVVKAALDQVIAVGPQKPETKPDTKQDQDQDQDQNQKEPSQEPSKDPEPTPSPSSSDKTDPTPTPSPIDTPQPKPEPTQPTPSPSPTQPTPSPKPDPKPDPKPVDPDEEAKNGSRLFRPSPQVAKNYAAGAAAQYGWTGQQWLDLEKIWERESNWRWYAQNPYSPAYGIPQCYYPQNMAAYGKYYRDDAAAQIDWGLNYIAGRYGSPMKAWVYWQTHNWY
ncbi:lytic transglycosylase [Bifidobacterium dolichotidis]|uniref:Lytic transglycosylase n=1 Tax=Bifidobacterium dolichotidis TaxID=2306976 RepID=A0A430FNX0_9BIFI|nr:G5 domain-containing protein [Bifidobacterium dolichotidis]RSX54519.1 lytic transglycosylase [Bifidobacterium dolichotidis]